MQIYKLNDRVRLVTTAQRGTVSYAGPGKCQVVWDSSAPTSVVSSQELIPLGEARWVEYRREMDASTAQACRALGF